LGPRHLGQVLEAPARFISGVRFDTKWNVGQVPTDWHHLRFWV